MPANQTTRRTRQTLTSQARLLAALAAGVCSAGGASRAVADTWVWTGNRDLPEWSIDANWNHTAGSSSSDVPISSPDTIVDFGSSTETTADQDISNPIELNSLGFNSGASSFALQGDALEFLNSSTSVAPTIVQNSSNSQDVIESITLGNNTTISGSGTGAVEFLNAISGSGALTDSATATVDLLVSNSYSGGTTINGGQIIIANTNAFGSGTITFTSGTITSTTTLSMDNNFFNNTGSVVSFQAAASTTLTINPSSALFGSLNFGSSTETGTIDFAPATFEYFGGQINVNGGTVLDGFDVLSQILSSYGVSIASSATLNINGFSTTINDLIGAGTLATGTNSSETFTLQTASFSGKITGSGKLIVAGGTITLSGSNSYTGGTTLNSGQLVVSNNNSLGTGLLTLNGGTLTATSNAALSINFSDESATSPITIQATAGTTLTLGNTNTTASLGPQTLTFGSPTDTGTVDPMYGLEFNTNSTINVNGGILLDGDGLVAAVLYADILNIAKSATLDLDGNSTVIEDLLGAGTLATGNNVGETCTLSAANFSGNITGSTQIITTAGGTIVLTGSNTYSGGSTFGGGLVGAGNNSALGSGAVTVTAGTKLYAAGGNITLANPVSINSGQSLTIVDDPNGADNLTLSKSISGSGSLVMSSTGTLSLSASNSYSGGTTLNGGDLGINNTASLGSGPITFNGGTLTSTSTLTLNNNFSEINGSAVNLQAAAGTTMTVFSDSAAYGNLNFGSSSETGTINFEPNGSFFGGQLNVNGGTLLDGAEIVSQILPAYTVDIAQSATLNLNGFSTTISDLTGAGTLATGTNSSETFTLDAANFSGTITGSGKLIISGGTVTLSGSNSYTGGTTLSSGEVIINSDNSLGSTLGHLTIISGTITASSNASLNYNYDVDSATSPITFQAVAGVTLTLGGGADLESTQTLNFGSSSDTGTVDFSPGAESIFGGVSLNVNGGTLVDGDGLLPLLLGDDTLTVAKSATLNLNNDSSSFNDLLGAGTLATGTNSSETFTLDAANFSGNITGSGQLVTTNSGTVILSGANTYSGGSNFAGGTVGAGNGSALGSSTVTVTATTNLYAAGADQTLANPFSINSGRSLTIQDDPNGAHNLTLNGNINGSGSLVMSGTDTLTLHGTNSYTGGTTISSGTLAITSPGALPAAGKVLNNSVLSIQAGTASPTVSGAITGTGTLKIDPGLLQLAAHGGGSFQNALTLNAGSTLDLTDNSFLVDFGAAADPAATIRSELVSGFNASGAKWAGTGITSSLAAANPTHIAVGYADGGNARDRATTGITTGEVGIQYTVAGDANLSGSVDLSDLVIIASDFGMSGADWAEGDLNYDGNVDLSDLVVVASNFGASLSSVQPADFSSSFASEWQLALAEAHGADVSVPEPAELAVFATAGLFIARRRRKI